MRHFIDFFRRAIYYIWKVVCTHVKLIVFHGQIVAGKRSILYKTNVVGGGRIIIHDKVRMERCSFYFEGPDNVVEIEDGCEIYGMDIVMRYGGHNRVKIGAGTSVGGSLNIECSEGTSLTIGEDCMLSHFIRIFTTDMHSILDENGKRINKGRDVIIGDHVWIGMRVFVLKGSQIPDGSILGAASVYSGRNEEGNCIYAGNPAKKIKYGISWSRERLN